MVRQVPIDIKSLMHPAYFVPESMKVSHLLKEMQRRHTQMAIVVNEYGTVEGLATMEDLIEEIVGEIRDEYDLEERAVERLKDGSLVVDASLSVRDLKEEYGLPIPESPLYETLGGFVMAQLQNIPRSGAITHYSQLKFTIVDMEGRRIMKVKIEKVPGYEKTAVS
jgi:putative hemolysin